MEKKEKIVLEMFYTLTCPNCRIMKRLINEVLPEFDDKFVFKTSLANSPSGMVRTMRKGIHSVPTLLINNKIEFREVPTKEELINKLKMY
jgi:thiol-disulfide isomerase/thioredoxin